VLIDTDVWVWYLRGNAKAEREIAQMRPRHMSCVSYMELLQGVRDNRELSQLREVMSELEAKMALLDETISSKAFLLMEQYRLSHGLEMGDALLGATALSKGWTLLTGNEKHYRMIPGLKIKKFRP
jgi:hypothetical protein